MGVPKRSGVVGPIRDFVYSPGCDNCETINALVADLNQYDALIAFGLPAVSIPFAQLPAIPPVAVNGSEVWVKDGHKIGETGNTPGTGVNAYWSNGNWLTESGDIPVTAAPITFNSMFFARETLDYVSLGAGQLQYERTQQWTFYCQFQVAQLPATSVDAGILFTNVLGGLPYTGFEVWLDNNGFLRSRLINSFSGNCVSVIGSVNVVTGIPVFVAVTYDGSSTAAGIKLYVNGVLDAGKTVEFDTLSATIKAAGQFFRIGNQLSFTFGLQGYMGFVGLDNVVRSAGYIAGYGLARLPPNDPIRTDLYITFDDQIGGTVTDRSKNGFTGFLSDPTEWAGILPTPSTIAFDAIADGIGSAVSSLAATLTTAGAGELIYVFANTTNATPPVISDTAGLTWTLRAQTGTYAAATVLFSWYAIAPAKLNSDVITITGTAIYGIHAIAFSGQSSHPLAIPAGTSNQNNTGLAWPTAPSGLVIAFFACGVSVPTPGAGWTPLYDANFVLIEYKTNSVMIGSEQALIGSAEAGGIIEAIN